MGLKNFPDGYVPSSSQKYAIPNILEGFKDCKFVVLQGPTGCGKSFIAKTIANGLKKPPSRLSKIVSDYRAFETTRNNGKLSYEYSDDFINKNFGGIERDIINRLGTLIKNYRNPAAHPELINRDQAEKFYESYKKVMNKIMKNLS